MALTLVPRSVRALSDHINAYYRVLKGSDQDSVFLRLAAGGGSFEVRHSATNAPVFKVTDTGATLTVGAEDMGPGAVTEPTLADGAVSNRALAANAVTTDKIADGTIVDADISGSAAINGGKINTGSISGGASGQIAANTIASSNILDDTIVNADVSPSAAIAITKVAHVGANNVLKSNGTTANVAGQVVNADIAPAGTANIALAKLANVTTNQIVKDVGSGVIGGGLLVDANVAAAGTANIALAKLAPGSAGVLKSNGTVITAGNTVTSADIADGTIVNGDINAAAAIDGAKIADSSIASTKLIGGATIPANSIDSTHIVDGAIMNVDVNGAAGIVASKLAAGGTANRVVATADGTTMGLQQVVSAMIATGTIVSGNLAANAATQVGVAFGSSSRPATTSSAPTGLPEMSVPLTTIGGPCLILFGGVFQASGAVQLTVYYFLDGAAAGISRVISIPDSSSYILNALQFLHTPSAAAHIFEMRWSVNTGTGYADSTSRNLIVMELRR